MFSFKDWYAVNGERLNEQRKNRYNTDPEYRKRVLEVNRASRTKAKKNLPKTEKLRGAATPRVLTRNINGVEETLYTIGAVATELGCSIQALRLWERKGIIPRTSLRSTDKDGKGRGHRLYTLAMVDELRRTLTSQGRLPTTPPRTASPSSRRYVRMADGTVQEVELFLIGVLAQTLQKNVVALEMLESRGLFPSTPLRTSKTGRRLFSMPMIQVVWEAFKEFHEGEGPRGEDEWRALTASVLSSWTAQKVMGAVLVEEVPSEGASHAEVESSP